jgi:hypothetical protein
MSYEAPGVDDRVDITAKMIGGGSGGYHGYPQGRRRRRRRRGD